MPICQKIDRLEAIEANLIVAKGDDMHIVDLEQSRHCLRQHLAADVHRTKTGIRQVGFDSQPQIARRANICRVERNNNTPNIYKLLGFDRQIMDLSLLVAKFHVRQVQLILLNEAHELAMRSAGSWLGSIPAVGHGGQLPDKTKTARPNAASYKDRFPKCCT